jgi:hypothetical protein
MPLDGWVSTEVTALLRHARSLIPAPLWVKGSMHAGASSVRHCSMGALVTALVEADLYKADMAMARHHLDAAARMRGFHGIIHMNDADETTHGDLMAAWDDAIAMSERKICL